MKQILLSVVAIFVGLAIAGSADARGPGGFGVQSGGGTMSNKSAGVRNFNSGGATSARNFSQSSGFNSGNLSSRVASPKVTSNSVTSRGNGIGFNRDKVLSNKFESKVNNTGVFGKSGKFDNKALDPRVTTRPGDLFGKNGKLNDKVLDPRVTTRPSDLFGKGKNAGKLGDVLGKNGGLKDVIKNNGKLSDKLNGKLSDKMNGKLNGKFADKFHDKLNTKFSDKISTKLGKNFFKHGHHGHHHHHHHHNDWWCHKDFWSHKDYSCHSLYFDWCFPWYGPDWCWDYYPEVIIDTYPVYISEPVVIVETIVDLELVRVELLDVGEPARKLGPRFRVTARNVGTALVENAIVRIAAGRELDPAAFAKPIEATASFAVVTPGETVAVEVRLPLEAMTMNRTSEGTPAPFEALAAAVEPPPTLTDANPKNNFSLTPRKEIKLAGF